MSWISTLTCLVIPLLLILITRRAIIQQRERKVLREQHPQEPWLWRRDWAARTAVDQSHAFSALLWFIAAMWSLISMPVFFVMQERRGDPLFLVFATFPLIGVALIGVALYQTLRRRKYGLSACRFDALPIPVGRTLRGEVETRVADVPPDGFLLRLTCVRRIVKSSGKSTSTEERILWQEEQRAGAGAAMPNPNGVRVPFRFALPADAEEADERSPRNRVIWRLEVTAEVPGIDCRGVFELPVFTRVEDSAGIFAPAGEKPWTTPPSITFGVSDHGGDQITIKPATSAADWIFYVVFVVLWYGALAFMWKMGAPIAVVIIFTVFSTVVLYFALDRLGGRSTVSANRTHLTARRTFLGTRVIPSADIVSIRPRIGRNTGKRALYDLEARLQNGKTVSIARHMGSRKDAEMVGARILRALGR